MLLTHTRRHSSGYEFFVLLATCFGVRADLGVVLDDVGVGVALDLKQGLAIRCPGVEQYRPEEQAKNQENNQLLHTPLPGKGSDLINPLIDEAIHNMGGIYIVLIPTGKIILPASQHDSLLEDEQVDPEALLDLLVLTLPVLILKQCIVSKRPSFQHPSLAVIMEGRCKVCPLRNSSVDFFHAHERFCCTC